jgi:hypothetical protein
MFVKAKGLVTWRARARGGGASRRVLAQPPRTARAHSRLLRGGGSEQRLSDVPGRARAPLARGGMVGSWGGLKCVFFRQWVLALAHRRNCLCCPVRSLVHMIPVCQEVKLPSFNSEGTSTRPAG